MRTYLTTLPDIAASYHLDFPLGVSVTDFSKNANHAVLYGPHFVQGVIDHALFFDGIDDHAIAPLIDAYKFTGPFSLELFARRKAQTGGWQTLASTQLGVTSGYALTSLDDGTLIFYVLGLTPYHIDTTTPVMQNDLLLHIAAVYTGDNLQLFINGTLDTSVAVTGTPTIPTKDFYLGRYPGAAIEHYNGILDHLILYNRALSPPEIQRHSLRRYP